MNYQVAALRRSCGSEQFTKSRPRRSNDNALVESGTTDQGAQASGLGTSRGRHARVLLDQFNREVLSPYPPLPLPGEQVDAKGKVRKRYRRQDIQRPATTILAGGDN